MLKTISNISNLRDQQFMDDLFPFYILMDNEMRILNSGRSMDKLLNLKKSVNFFKEFKIQLPLFVSDYTSIKENHSSLFIFSSINLPEIQLRGQFYFDKKENLICFIGTPLINSFNDLENKNLQLSDFAIHDSINQFLFTLQMHISSMKDAQDLANKLKLSVTNLTEINDSLDDLIYKLTHDLRAPAVNIKSMLIMLSKHIEIEKDTKAEQLYSNSRISTEKLLQTIEDFLELSRLEKIEKRPVEACNINGIIEEIKNENSVLIKSNKVKFKINFNGLEMVVGVYDDLKSIFQNLITNSIKYRAKNRTPKIIITAAQNGKFIRFSYSDNGIGIDIEKHRNKLFEMFSRLHSDSSISGTGIGLYLVKKLALKNNGLIEITDSIIDKGTTFTIHLPNNNQNT